MDLWERGLDGWEPIARDIDQGMSDIAIGKELGVPAPEVKDLPNLSVRAALISIEVHSMLTKRQHARRQKGRN